MAHSQKCLAAKSPISTAPEMAVTKTMLIRLCVAIDIVEAAEASGGLDCDFLLFAFCSFTFADTAIPKNGGSGRFAA